MLILLVLLIFFAALIELNAASLRCDLKSCNGFQKLLLAISGNTCDSQDLSSVNIKAYVIQYLDFLAIIYSQMRYCQTFHLIHWCRTGNVQFYLFAYHHLCQRILCSFTGIYGAYIFAFSENCNLIRNL